MALIANMLVRIGCEDDKVLLKASVASILPVCDRIMILACGPDVIETLKPIETPNIVYIEVESDFCSTHGFAEARNILLQSVRTDHYVLWVDSDEVHFTNQLQQIKNTVLATEKFDDIRTHFVHFTLGSNAFEKWESRINIFRKDTGSHWEEKVHERIVHGNHERKLFHSDYVYHHYGYIRDQEIVFQRWQQYAQLEGKDAVHIEHEYPDHKVLDHRKASLIPYFGEYPSAIPQEWISKKQIRL